MPGNAARTKLRSLREITRHRDRGKPQDNVASPNCLASLANESECCDLDMSMLASFMNLGGPDLIIILLIILVLFGAKKLPELARGLGQAIKEFQKAKDEFSDELHKAGKTDTAAKGNLPPSSTVPRTDATASTDQNQAVTPGDKADQV